MLKLTINQINLLKVNAIAYASACEVAMVLDSNQCQSAYNLKQVELMAGFGAENLLTTNQNSFENLEEWVTQHQNKPIFFQFNYDLKNELEHLTSNHADIIAFDALAAFTPKEWFLVNKQGVCEAGEELVLKLLDFKANVTEHNTPILLQQRVSKQDYVQTIEQIKKQIVDGDFYELNYCMEFYAHQAIINPEQVYLKLVGQSPAPFAAYYKNQSRYLLCASPERFLTKIGEKVYSQPIKGTAPRSEDEIVDKANRASLLGSEKEKAENLMIVDLVRNDLAKNAKVGTVCVEELFGIYGFKQVYQMISTISAISAENTSSVQLIKDAFPMGSMTGAPKVEVMVNIEKYEKNKRGLYSGAIGYRLPNGNFDLNVVIRSLQYNADNQYLNFMVGSAITFDSVAEEEYQECLLKAKAMIQIIS